MAEDHHQLSEIIDDRRLGWAIAINMGLTLVQVIGGLVSGSLALLADALHNFSDAASLLISWVARRIGRQPPDYFKTFGYKRAEVIAALINLVLLVLVGIYLFYEALWRMYEPQVIAGWPVVIVAAVTLVVDVGTAFLTYTMSKHSINIRAAFLHNVSDALASVGVIAAGSLILLYGWYWTDTALTLLIAGYVLYQAASLFPKTIHILMEGTPKDISIEEVIKVMNRVEGVVNVHHLHLWQLDEYKNALEAHVVIADFSDSESIKIALKTELEESFSIAHTTLEFEIDHCGEACAP